MDQTSAIMASASYDVAERRSYGSVDYGEAPPVELTALEPWTGEVETATPSSGSVPSITHLKEEMIAKEDDRQTDWKAVGLATVITFMTMVESSIVQNGEWPYMNTIDPDATTSFFGATTAVCKGGHAIFVIFFALAEHRFHHTKWLILLGRVISTAGGILYIFVEFFPVNRRFVLLISYFIFGIGASPTPLLRSYVSLNSREEHRTKAFALLNVSTVLSVLVGPLVQLAFSGIKYPGHTIFGELKFHIFSAPMYVSLLLNVIASFLIIFLFEDPPIVEAEDVPSKERQSSFSWTGIKSSAVQLWGKMRSMPFSWPIVALLIVMKPLTGLTTATMQANVGPLLMIVYALSSTETVQLMSVAQIVVGVLAISLSLLLIFANLGRWISNRLLFLIAFSITITMYAVSYPWPMWSHHVELINSTTHAGCDPAKYGWCYDNLGSSVWTLIPILVVQMGFCVPAFAISLDAIYSKALGDIDQSLMQSVFSIAEDLMLVVGPLYSSAIFTAAGMPVLWIVNFSITAVSIGIWVLIWRPIAKYQ